MDFPLNLPIEMKRAFRPHTAWIDSSSPIEVARGDSGSW